MGRKRQEFTFDCSQETTLGMSPTSLPSSGCVIRKSTSWPVGFPLWKGFIPASAHRKRFYMRFSLACVCFRVISLLKQSRLFRSETGHIKTTLIFICDANPAKMFTLTCTVGLHVCFGSHLLNPPIRVIRAPGETDATALPTTSPMASASDLVTGWLRSR